jgi:DNA (cytosine-5)-methyltransferase 1
MQPRLLDLFCGAGGAAKGYYEAGFDIVGVDINPQPHFPYTFIQADAMTFPLDGYDVIHASPPCQGYSRSLGLASIYGIKVHPLLIGDIRGRLEASGKIWVIENVEGAPLPDAVELCGSMFGLPIRRHRWFASSEMIFAPGGCRHTDSCINAVGNAIRGYGSLASKTVTYVDAKGATRKREGRLMLATGRLAMGIDWMSTKELCQAIPPAYTRWIGQFLLAAVQAESEVGRDAAHTA